MAIESLHGIEYEVKTVRVNDKFRDDIGNYCLYRFAYEDEVEDECVYEVTYYDVESRGMNLGGHFKTRSELERERVVDEEK